MALLLTIETGTLTGRRFVLEGAGIELGRDAACTIRFGEQDRQVSRLHASLTPTADGGFRLVDHSANGTLVNGRRFRELVVRPGDVVQLGADGPRLSVGPGAVSEMAAATVAARLGVVERVEARLYCDPSAEKGRRSGLRSLSLVLGMVLAGASLGLLTALLIFYQLGFGAALVGIVVAFLPAPAYLAVWLWLDRYDPEPAWILAGAFVWGAGAATFVAGIINSLVHATALAVTGNQAAAAFLQASVSAPLAEELLKGLPVVVFVLRGVLGPFSHAVFTSMTGIGCGLARQSHKTSVRLSMPVLGYLGAVTLHGLWNTLAGLSGGLGGVLLIYVLVWAPLFLCFFGVMLYLGHRESRLIQRMLQLEVARGLLRSEQVAIVASWPRRIGWLVSDWSRFRARRRFLHATTRLALCYWHASRAAVAGGETLSATRVPGFQREIQELLPQI